jgi:hypothetical protein
MQIEVTSCEFRFWNRIFIILLGLHSGNTENLCLRIVFKISISSCRL